MMLLWWGIFAWTQCYTLAGPAGRMNRVVREVYPPEIEPENAGSQAQVCIVGDVVYGADEVVPADQPCLKCRCQPPEVQCETIQCIKTPGCKAVHRANRCCPDYQCECQYEGKIYSNGENVQTAAGAECKVCYCRGGEIQCADVSCYKRTDCQGKIVPGQCCPRYDHCPPIIEPTGTLLPEVNTEVLELWSITNILPNSSTYSPEDTNKIPDSSTSKKAYRPEIVIQEIIPEPSTESPLSAVESVETEEPNAHLIGSDLDAAPASSEISEIMQEAPPSTTAIADKLLFRERGEVSAPPSPVTLIAGTESPRRQSEDNGELKTSASTHILSLLKRKSTTTEAPSSTTDATGIDIEGVQEQNPAYPAIVDVLILEKDERILPDILPARSNKTIVTSANATSSGWLKNDSLANQTTNDNVNNPDVFKVLERESLEAPDSGETVTIGMNQSAPVISNENASVDLQEDDVEISDMTENSSPPNTNNVTLLEKDAEMIDSMNLTLMVDHEKVKIVVKRATDDDVDAVFRQLNAELDAEVTERTITEEEDKRESERIFKELLEESSTPKYRQPPKNKEQEMLQRVSDAIASVTLKKNPFDSNVFGLITNFFGNQYKSYGSNK